MVERVAYVNGELVKESKAMISIRDLGLVYGSCVFDTSRTFGGKIFRLQQHIDRLLQSLDYIGIHLNLSDTEIIAATEEVVAQNLSVLSDGEDYWVTQRVTAGVQQLDGEIAAYKGPTVIIDCIPLPLRSRSSLFKCGIEAIVSKRPKIAPEALSPNAKTNNYLNMMLAQQEVQSSYPAGWAIMPDSEGNLAEGAGCNFFIVKDGIVFTPEADFVLAGVSREVVIELCNSLGIEIRECGISPEFAMLADEAFFTSTSLCICPVKSLNGRSYASTIPGPITSRLTDAFIQLADFDFVQQYLSFSNKGTSGIGL